MSAAYAFDLELLSGSPDLSPAQLLGTAATVLIRDPAGPTWTCNGIISHLDITELQSRRSLFTYRARLVPLLWLLTRTSDCRIFQNKTTHDIVDAILMEHGITQRSWKLYSDYEPRLYCVQYRETDYDFVCRLLEEDGIFFYFTHSSKSHTIVFTDKNIGLTKSATPTVAYAPEARAMGGVWQWQNSYRFRSGQWALSDYDFEAPSLSLATTTKTVNAVLGKRALEMFDYPGRYVKKAPGDALTKLRMEYEEATYQEVSGESGCTGFVVGACFSLSDTKTSPPGVEYLLTEIEHIAQDLSTVSDDAASGNYQNRFKCRPRSVPYRPQRKTPSPRIHGAQTATVTGAGGTEICTDNYGRIKVHFHWDRHGKKDDSSSCWIRVAQSWAGKGWGGWFVPRIGQEVVVTFLEGDPDRPMVVGSVYNAEQPVPFPLPANATQSGLRTRSSMGGSPANCNELRFEDRSGAEQVYLHAERNLDTSVEHDETHLVGHDQTLTVQHDRKKSITNDETHVVGHNQSLTVQNNRTKAITVNETTTVGGNRTETVSQNESVTIALTRTHTIGTVDTHTVGAAHFRTVGAAETVSVGAFRALSVGAYHNISVGAAQSVQIGATHSVTVGSSETRSIGGSHTVTVGGDESVTVGGSESVTVSGDGSRTVSGNETISVSQARSATVSQDDTTDVTGAISITAGKSITLTTGSASITMQKNGDISIEGKDITIKGSGNVLIKGQKILQN